MMMMKENHPIKKKKNKAKQKKGLHKGSGWQE